MGQPPLAPVAQLLTPLTFHQPSSSSAPSHASSTLTPPPHADAQTTALWQIAAAAPALVADRGWGAPASDATTWRGVDCDDDGRVVGLDVSEGGMTAFPDGALRTLPHLRSLVATTNTLRAVPADVGALHGLTLLDVGNNAIKSVDGIEAPALRVLRIALNPVDRLPALSLPLLEWLDASECALTEVGDLSALTSMSRLDLYGNRLLGLPRGVEKLGQSLVRLSLHSNELVEIGDEVRRRIGRAGGWGTRRGD